MWEVESKLMEQSDVNDFELRAIHPSEEGFQIAIASMEEERATGQSDLVHGLDMRQLSLNVVSSGRVGKADGWKVWRVPPDLHFHVSLNRT